MRKSILWLALAAVLSASAASAQVVIVPGSVIVSDPKTRPGEITEIPGSPGHWYVGGEFGAMIVEDMNVDVGAVDSAITINHDYGYDGGIFVGYDFGAFRLEAEAAYKKADIKDYQTTIRLPLEGPLFAAGRDGSGSSSALSFMINGMLDFGDDDGISGFVGGGVGIARVKANNYRNFANATPFLDGSDSKLAWQVFAGVRQRVRDNIDVTVKYRFFNVDKVELLAFNGAESELRFRSHSLLGGITFRFGGTGPVTICKSTGAPVTEANPCTVPVCENGSVLNTVTGKCEIRGEDKHYCLPNGSLVSLDTKLDCEMKSFDVYFGWDKRHVGEPSDPGEDPNEDVSVVPAQPTVLQTQLQRLQEAYEAYVKSGNVRVNIVGRADRSGDEAYNRVLSCDRAHAARQYFVDKGVPQYVIQIEGRGETEAQGVVDRELQDRRVSITVNAETDLAGCPEPVPSAKY